MSKRWLGLLLLVVVWIGGGAVAHAVPTITVSPQSPPTVDLGNVRVTGTATATKVFTIGNSGDETLTVTAITFTSSDYTLDPTTLPSIPSGGASQTVTVRFHPSAVGARPATMSIVSNDAATPTTVALTGTGTAAVLAVADVNFGTVNAGGSSALTLAVTNAAATPRAPLTVTSASISGSGFYVFGNTLGCGGGTTCTFNPPLVIDGGTSNVPVICQPPATASGSSVGTVTFTSDTDAGGDTTAQLSCTAARPNLVVSISPLAFGDVAVGANGVQTVSLMNNGNASLTYSLSEVPSLAQYTLSGCITSCPLAAGVTTTFTLTFTPTAQGSLTTRIDIASNDPDPGDNTISINASGSGLQGVLATTPSTLDFGGVAQGTTKPLTFTLKNTGNVRVTGITGTLAGGGAGYVFDTTSVPAALDPSEQKTLTVTFAPQLGSDGGTKTLTFQGSWTAGSVTAQTTAAVALTGDGLTASYAVAPTAIDFGDFRFDSLPKQIFTITNTGEAPLSIAAPLFTPDAGTGTNDFAFEVRRPNVTTLVTLPATLNPTDRFEVTVIAKPVNRIGLVSGHVTVHANLGADVVVTLTGNGTAAGITVPAPIEFGSVDVDGPAASRTVALTNTGSATLDITSFETMAGASPAFHVTLPSGVTHVPPNADVKVVITYDPTVALPANQLDRITLIANLSGVAGGLTQAQITATGHPIDRNLSVAAVQTFPSAFRNPGDAAPVQPITVSNTGEALLKITGVMLTGDPVWQLVDSSAIEIAGGTSHDVLVKFSPTAIGAAPIGQLVLTNDDNARPMAMVTLSGTGVRRNVAFGPATGEPTDIPTIDLGPIGVGIPTTMADVLAVVNMDPTVQFTIHAIELSDNTVFQLDSTPTDEALPAGMTRQFGLTFEATAAGPVSATARLYLDQDPEVHAEVNLVADAVFIDAHGGGGCDAGAGSAGSGSVIGLGVVAALGLLGRRRRRASGAVVAGLASTIALAPPARADGIDLAVFAPTPATTGTGFQLQSPDVGVAGSWTAGATVSYASNPLVLEGSSVRNALVERSTLIEPGFAYAFLDRFEAGAHIPLFMQSGQAPVDANGVRQGLGVAPADGTATGNLTLNAKARLWRGGGKLGWFVAGASGIVVVPTATKGQFTGSDQVEGRLLLLGSFTPVALASRLAISVNAGPILRGKSEYANIVQQSGVAWGAGASFRVLDGLWATAELFGEATPSGKRQDMAGATTLSPIEWLAGVTVKADRRFTVGLAAGRGATDAIGTPELRAMVSLAFVAGAPARAQLSAADRGAPDQDTDGDGIPDSVDKCPNEPEDKDMFEDDDGCPDPDNDHDGIPDALDKCPLDPEDKDGFQDEDGCPDKDNDGDGIPDKLDKCPNEPEDKDGFEDLDGCPELDNDHDGIPDDKDKCPNEPETINGFQDEDGCPDKGDTTIVLSPDRIETLDPIQFAGLKLTRASLGLLGQVGSTLRAHPEILRLRITVHVQPTADPAADQTRSERRAQAVRDWLVQWGIAPSRLDTRGFGSAKPLIAPDQRGAAKINDRLELIILERR